MYTRAAPTAPTIAMPAKNTRLYIADARRCRARRRPAAKPSVSSSPERPNSFTSRAPATPKRSVIVVFIEALRSMPWRVIACKRRPTRRVGSRKSGASTSPRSVSRHSRTAMAMSVVTSVMTFDTTDPSVPVSARWAPITSLFMRPREAPVCVRVKKAIGIRCTWSNSRTRRSKIRPSPIRADVHRSTRLRPGREERDADHEQRRGA